MITNSQLLKFLYVSTEKNIFNVLTVAFSSFDTGEKVLENFSTNNNPFYNKQITSLILSI